MSSIPPELELPKINKFVGEGYEISNVRTIYAGGADDDLKRTHRVMILIGPKKAGKAYLIDFFCSYFYGASANSLDRYHIANEQFNEFSPQKLISTYIFNNTRMRFRPVLIDTPCVDYTSEQQDINLIDMWLKDNNTMRIDVIAVVLSSIVRLSSQEQDQLSKTLALLPPHVRSKLIVIMTESDDSPPPPSLLERLNLREAPVYKVNTSCLFLRPQGDSLEENVRQTKWHMSYANLENLFTSIHLNHPVTISGQPHEKKSFPGSFKDSGSEASSSFSSRQSSFREAMRSPIESVASSAGNDSSDPHSSSTAQTVVTREPATKSYASEEHYSSQGQRLTTISSVSEVYENATTETLKRFPSILSAGETDDVDGPPPAVPLATRPPQPPPPPPPSQSTLAPPLQSNLPTLTSSLSKADSVPNPAPLLPPPPPPPPSSSFSRPAPSQQLLESIRNSSKALGREESSAEMKDVVVVNYNDNESEVVVLNHNEPQRSSRSFSESISRMTSSHHEVSSHDTRGALLPKAPDFPPPMNPISRPYDLPPSGAKPRRPPMPMSPNSNVTSERPGAFPISPANKDTLKVYSDETTPPPPSNTVPVTKNVSSTYSTLVFMNDNGTYTTDKLKSYTPSTKPPQPDAHASYSQAPVYPSSPRSPYSTSLTDQLKDKDAWKRNSNYQTLPYSDMIRSTDSDAHNVRYSTYGDLGSLERGYSSKSKYTSVPVGDISPVRYVYETASRNYVPYAVGGRSLSRQGREFERRKRESRSLEPFRHSQVEGEAYHASSGFIRIEHATPLRHSTTSLNHITSGLPELIQAEDKYSLMEYPQSHTLPKETVIDYKSPTFDGHRTSSYDPYASVRTAYPDSSTLQRNQPNRLSDANSFSINPNRNSNALLLERDRLLKQTREDVKRDSYPNSRIYQNLPNPPLDVTNRYDPVPQHGTPNRNSIIIPTELRNGKPIQINVDMKEKNKQQNEPHIPPHRYTDADYGENWDPNANAERNSQRYQTPTQTQPQYQELSQQPHVIGGQRVNNSLQRNRPDNLNIGSGAVAAGPANDQGQRNGTHGYGQMQENGVRITETTYHPTGFLTEVNDPRSPPPPPYMTRPYPATPGYTGGDGDVGMRQQQMERQPLRSQSPRKGKKNAKTQPKRKTSSKSPKTTKVTTRRRRQKSQIECLNWSPSECGNPRDCCLNLVFFLVIPLIILAVIATIIIIVVTSHKNEDYRSTDYYGNNYNSYGGSNYNNRYQY